MRILTLFLVLFAASTAVAETWRDLTIAPENRCSPYNKKKNYPYPQSVEQEIVAEIGGPVYGSYTGRIFGSTRETGIEHMVAASEAHDSGLCAASAQTKRAVVQDVLNLTLAAPMVNRHQKNDKDVAEWLLDRNQCWFTDRIAKVRQKDNHTIDKREAEVLERVLSGCDSMEMVVYMDDVATEQSQNPDRKPSSEDGGGKPTVSPSENPQQNPNTNLPSENPQLLEEDPCNWPIKPDHCSDS